MARRDSAPEPTAEQPLEQSVRDVTPAADEPAAPALEPVEGDTAPPYYIATEPLFIGNQFGRAHNPGDHVPADHVEKFGWADKVRRPDTPQQPPAAPTYEPETSPGQATSKEGDA